MSFSVLLALVWASVGAALPAEAAASSDLRGFDIAASAAPNNEAFYKCTYNAGYRKPVIRGYFQACGKVCTILVISGRNHGSTVANQILLLKRVEILTLILFRHTRPPGLPDIPTSMLICFLVCVNQHNLVK